MAHRITLLAVAVIVASAVLGSGGAFASNPPPSLFWANYGPATIGRANLDGSGAAAFDMSAGASQDDGVAIDAAGGRVYWAERGADQIGYANLDGSGSAGVLDTTGTTPDGPSGVGIDPGTGRIYWSNNFGNSIGYANLAGGGGGILNTSGATVAGPEGIGVDVAAGRLYWGNPGGVNNGHPVSWARLDGTGGGEINTGGASDSAAVHPAVDRAGGRVYWANYGNGTISYANLDDSGGGDLNTTGVTPANPSGVAIDRGHNRIYWTDYGDSKIEYANLDGSGAGGELNTTGFPASSPFGSPALFEVPVAVTGAASGLTATGATLNATVNPDSLPTTYHFEYGTTTTYGTSVPAADAAVGSDTADHAVSQSLTGLQPATTYHFRVVATSTAGTATGGDQVFTTGANAPVATTLDATSVSQTGATLQGSVNPNGAATSYHFEYGTTSAFGSATATQSLAAGGSAQTVSAPLTSLAPSTTYHVRLVATSAGGTSSGGERTFTTASPPTPPAVTGLTADHRCVRAATLTGPGASGALSFAFTLSADATVHYSVLRRVSSPHWKKCPAGGGMNALTFNPVGSYDVQTTAGHQQTSLGSATAAAVRRSPARRLRRGRHAVSLARIAASQPLGFGTYLLRVTATNADGSSTPVEVKFWVLGSTGRRR